MGNPTTPPKGTAIYGKGGLVESGTSSGRYGEVLEHPLIRGLKWMVIGPTVRDSLRAVCVASPARERSYRVGDKSDFVDRYGWIIERE